MSCVTLAAIASSSKGLQAAVQSLARSNSTAAHLLCKIVCAAAIYPDESQYQQALTWLYQLEGFDAAEHLQGSTAAALLGTPFVPYSTAAALAAAGLQLSWQQVVEACAGPVAGAWVWVKAGAVADAPELARHMLCYQWLVSKTVMQCTPRYALHLLHVPGSQSKGMDQGTGNCAQHRNFWQLQKQLLPCHDAPLCFPILFLAAGCS
jgi:hypothetical protein